MVEMLADFFKNPTVTTIFVMLGLGLLTLYFGLVHPGKECKERRKEEIATALKFHDDLLQAKDERIKDLQERLLEVENERDENMRLILRLAGVLEEVPAILRKKG